MYAIIGTTDALLNATQVEVPSLGALVMVTPSSLPALRALITAGITVRMVASQAAARKV